MSIWQQAGAIRCVTINLAGLHFDWFGQRFDALVRGLRPLDLDVICFQEATVRKGGASYNQAWVVGEALGLPFVAFAPYGNPIEATTHEVGGVAIASRWPIGVAESWRLPEGTVAPDNRVALLVKLIAPWGDLSVATTHLSWRPEEAGVRAAQLDVILDHLCGLGLCRQDARLVLAGDLNALEDEPAVANAGRHFRDCFRGQHPGAPGFTWRRTNPLTQGFGALDRRLDYAFCPADAQVSEALVVLDRPDPVYPSDHFGLFVAIDFQGSRSRGMAAKGRTDQSRLPRPDYLRSCPRPWSGHRLHRVLSPPLGNRRQGRCRPDRSRLHERYRGRPGAPLVRLGLGARSALTE